MRLKHWNYADDGYYFITICTGNREHFFGEVINSKMKLSNIGKLSDRCWQEIPEHFPFTVLDEYMIMPNYIHGIIMIDKTEFGLIPASVETRHGASLPGHRRKFGPLQKKSISLIINHYKGAVTTWCRKNSYNFAWQSSYYNHVIENEKSLMKIREYISHNPLRWELDRNNPKNLFV